MKQCNSEFNRLKRFINDRIKKKKKDEEAAVKAAKKKQAEEKKAAADRAKRAAEEEKARLAKEQADKVAQELAAVEGTATEDEPGTAEDVTTAPPEVGLATAEFEQEAEEEDVAAAHEGDVQGDEEVVAAVEARDAEEAEEAWEDYVPVPSTSRAGAAPSASLPTRTRRRVALPKTNQQWFNLIHKAVVDNGRKIDTLSTEFVNKMDVSIDMCGIFICIVSGAINVCFQSYARQRKDMIVELNQLKKSMVEVYLAQSKSTMQREMDLDSCKKLITKYLPLNEIGATVDVIFTTAESKRAIKEMIKMHMTSKGMHTFNERQLALEAVKLCFTSYMRAHFYMSSANYKR